MKNFDIMRRRIIRKVFDILAFIGFKAKLNAIEVYENVKCNTLIDDIDKSFIEIYLWSVFIIILIVIINLER